MKGLSDEEKCNFTVSKVKDFIANAHKANVKYAWETRFNSFVVQESRSSSSTRSSTITPAVTKVLVKYIHELTLEDMTKNERRVWRDSGTRNIVADTTPADIFQEKICSSMIALHSVASSES